MRFAARLAAMRAFLFSFRLCILVADLIGWYGLRCVGLVVEGGVVAVLGMMMSMWDSEGACMELSGDTACA